MTKDNVSANNAQGKEVSNKHVAEETKVSNNNIVAERKELSINELKTQLENQLKRISFKNEIARNRERFLTTKEELKLVKNFLSKENIFESNGVRLLLKKDNNTITIANSELILKFIEMLSVEIDNKVKEIEIKLIED